MYLQEGGILPIGEEPLFLQLEAEDEEALEKAKAAIQQAMDSIKVLFGCSCNILTWLLTSV